MDFGIIYQLKTKKFWWLDTILYFTVALLLATIICWAIFGFKISLQKKKLKEIENKIAGTGTAQQKELEQKVFEYQKKIDNFATLLVNHKIPTNILNTITKETLSNVWFYNFQLDAKTSSINAVGEAESMTALIKQADIFERNEFIKEILPINLGLTETGRVQFTLKFTLNQKIFFPAPASPAGSELPEEELIETVSPSSSLFLNKNIF